MPESANLLHVLLAPSLLLASSPCLLANGCRTHSQEASLSTLSHSAQSSAVAAARSPGSQILGLNQLLDVILRSVRVLEAHTAGAHTSQYIYMQPCSTSVHNTTVGGISKSTETAAPKWNKAPLEGEGHRKRQQQGRDVQATREGRFPLREVTTIKVAVPR